MWLADYDYVLFYYWDVVSVWGSAGALHDLLSLCVETQQRHVLDFEATYRLEQLGKSLIIGFFQAQTRSVSQGDSVRKSGEECVDVSIHMHWP